jgi:hypothetical protein
MKFIELKNASVPTFLNVEHITDIQVHKNNIGAHVDYYLISKERVTEKFVSYEEALARAEKFSELSSDVNYKSILEKLNNKLTTIYLYCKDQFMSDSEKPVNYFSHERGFIDGKNLIALDILNIIGKQQG